KADQPDAVDLAVDIKEGPTGTFTIGAGYSSGDGFIFNASVSEKNLFGRGQGLNGSFSIGSSRQDFIVGFTEPYLNDTQLSLGFDAFNTKREFQDFDERKLGFGVRTTYPLNKMRVPFFGAARSDPANDELASNAPATLWDHMRGGMAYELTRDKISGVDTNAPESIKSEKGTSFTSAMTPSVTYDSRDHFFSPTEGTKSGLSVKFAGLGGENRFLKSDANARWHYSPIKDPSWGGTYTVALGGTLGWGVGLKERANGKKDLPLFERYFLGGINSVRGFAERSLGPKDGNDVVGGDKQAVFNAELMFPVAEQYGLRGLAFFDMGQAFKGADSFSFGDFRRSVGVGARWLSPFGPLRLELGFPLNKKSGDDTSVLGFSIGTQP
ncbi:MAG TPA: BamA/TamA family outer membrane protein, partial [Candidatus Binatia bacterium]|nr:BamA/TamA family outer membrane protein [Candidatus Binatia bacterium]